MPSHTITVKFDATDWKEQTPPEGVTTRIAVMEGTFTGDMAGDATAVYILTPFADDPETFRFDAHQKFKGTLLGRRASFTMHKQGTCKGPHFKSIVRVIPDSASEEVKGLTGVQEWDVPVALPGNSATAQFKFELP